MDALVRALPYRLPRTTRDAVFALADILRIPRARVRGDGCVDNAFLLGAMAGVILYRHLPPHAKSQVIARCRKLIAARLSVGQALLNRVLATWGVTPDWGVWSMSNEELQEALTSDARLKFWLDAIGKLANGTGDAGSAWSVVATSTRGVPAVVVGYIIYGATKALDFEADYTDTKYEKELAHRQLLLSSKYY